MTRTIRRIGLFAFLALFLAPAALAQGNQGPPPPPQMQQQQPPPDIEVSDDEMATVAAVFLDIEALQMEYRPQVEQAEGQEEIQALQMEFQQEVITKIEDQEDITPQRFDQIMRAAQTDESLQNRISSAVESARADEGN